MRCVRCTQENRPGRRYCSECGAELPRGCAACSFVNQPGEKFCGGCAQALTDVTREPLAPLLAERHPVTILFADLAGYARLSSSLEPDEVHRLLDRFLEATDGAVLRHGGSIERHVGDNVTAIFGAPLAHGNDPERAVRAALDIHAAAAELSQSLGVSLRVRIGIASGEVMASELGSSHQRAYTVSGDAVNLAARLRDRATAGETMVASDVHSATESVAVFEPVGEIQLKGLPKPAAVWKVIGLRATPTASGRVFVGRRSELRHIHAVLEGCLDEARGSAICIRGEAGLGKTRLLAEVSSLATHLGFRVHRGRVLDFGAGADGGAILSLSEGLLGLSPESCEAERRRAVELSLEQDLLSQEHAPFIRELVGVPLEAGEVPLDAELEHAARANLRIDALVQLVDRSSRRHPLLLAVEDIHWADRMTMRFLGRLAALVSHCRAALLLTTRVDGDPLGEAFRAETGHSPLFRIDLAPLRHEEALAFAGELESSVDDVTRRCIERAAGNPLFLEQLLASHPDGDRLQGTIASLVLSRVDRLPRSARAALQVASVLGQYFEIEALRALHPNADVDCAELVRRRFVHAEGAFRRFHHASIRDAVYASLTRAEREELHRAASVWYRQRDPVLCAEHLELGGEPAASAYLRAAETLAAGYHFERAGVLLDHAVDLAHDNEEQYELSCLRGKIGNEGGAPTAAALAYERALSVASTDEQRCAALIGQAFAHGHLSNYQPLLSALEGAEPIAVALDLPRERAQIHYLRGRAFFVLGRRGACLREHERALEQAHRAGDPEWEARAESGLGDAHYALGQIARAKEHYERCIAVCERHGYERFAAPNRVMYALAHLFGGDLAAASTVAKRALAAVERTRDANTQIVVHHGLAMILLLQGNYAAARREAHASQQAAEKLGARRFHAEGLVWLALAEERLGRAGEAEELLDSAVTSAREAGVSYSGPLALGALAAVTRDAAKARAALAEGESIIEAGTLAHNALWFTLLGLRFALKRHDAGLARRYAERLLDFARRDSLALCELAGRAAELELSAWAAPADESLALRRRALFERAAELGVQLEFVLGA